MHQHRTFDSAVALQGWFSAWGPASIANLGPGFDTLGLCVTGYADKVAVRLKEEPGIVITDIENAAVPLSRNAEENTASVAAKVVLDAVKFTGGLEMIITKGIPAGSGMGSSAASAVAGAWAANKALGLPLSKHELVRAVLEGESIASGSYHGDNVLPALFGNLVLVSAKEPARYREISIRKGPFMALVQPEVQILTKEARAILPKQVPLWDAVQNASELAFMLDAFQHGDWDMVGRCIMKDKLVEPVRATLLPCYHEIKEAALAEKALGCAISGSGPAMFALATDEIHAYRVLAAMTQPNRAGIRVTGKVVQVNTTGAE
jgi:homoserine kinase